jgi:hypothetical protein
MGVLTDLILADKSAAEEIAQLSHPSSMWRVVDAKGHNEITLGTLLCILRGEDYNEAALDEFPLLAQKSEEGPWVFAIPDALVISLNQLDSSQIPKVVYEWLKTEEMLGYEHDDAEKFVVELKALATEAISQQMPILMWVSL